MVRNEDDYELAKRFDMVSSQLQSGGRLVYTVAALASHDSRYFAYCEGQLGEGAVGHMTERAVVDVADPRGHKERWRYVRVDPQEVKPHGCLPESAVHPAALPTAAL